MRRASLGLWLHPDLRLCPQGAGPQGSRSQGIREHLLAAEELHSQKGEDHDEQEEEEQQADDGFHGVEKRDDQVPERCPVPANRGRAGERR